MNRGPKDVKARKILRDPSVKRIHGKFDDADVNTSIQAEGGPELGKRTGRILTQKAYNYVRRLQLEGKANPGMFLDPEQHPTLNFPVFIGEEGEPISLYTKTNKALGKGAFGEVFLGVNMDTGKVYAVKKQSPKTEHAKQEIEKEDGILSELGLLSDKMKTEGGLFFGAQELAWGMDIEKYFQDKTIPIEQRTHVMRLALEKLDEFHQKDYLHRDIKMENLIYDPEEDMVYVIDVGLASKMDNGRTLSDMQVGTLLFMSPQILDLKTDNLVVDPSTNQPKICYDRSSEMYAAGVMMALAQYEPKDELYQGFINKQRLKTALDCENIMKVWNSDPSTHPAITDAMNKIDKMIYEYYIEHFRGKSPEECEQHFSEISNSEKGIVHQINDILKSVGIENPTVMNKDKEEVHFVLETLKVVSDASHYKVVSSNIIDNINKKSEKDIVDFMSTFKGKENEEQFSQEMLKVYEKVLSAKTQQEANDLINQLTRTGTPFLVEVYSLAGHDKAKDVIINARRALRTMYGNKVELENAAKSIPVYFKDMLFNQFVNDNKANLPAHIKATMPEIFSAEQNPDPLMDMNNKMIQLMCLDSKEGRPSFDECSEFFKRIEAQHAMRNNSELGPNEITEDFKAYAQQLLDKLSVPTLTQTNVEVEPTEPGLESKREAPVYAEFGGLESQRDAPVYDNFDNPGFESGSYSAEFNILESQREAPVYADLANFGLENQHEMPVYSNPEIEPEEVLISPAMQSIQKKIQETVSGLELKHEEYSVQEERFRQIEHTINPKWANEFDLVFTDEQKRNQFLDNLPSPQIRTYFEGEYNTRQKMDDISELIDVLNDINQKIESGEIDKPDKGLKEALLDALKDAKGKLDAEIRMPKYNANITVSAKDKREQDASLQSIAEPLPKAKADDVQNKPKVEQEQPNVKSQKKLKS